MKYILSEKIALRSWKDAPSAYYIRGREHARFMEKGIFDVLLHCDGMTELEEDGLIRKLLEKKFIIPAPNGAQLSDWQKPRFFDNDYVPTIDLRITGRCNFNCRHCFNAADVNRDMSEWSMEEIRDLLDEARDMGVYSVKITGGEPLLHPHFTDILREIYNRDMRVEHIITNGHFIDRKLLDEMHEIGCRCGMWISFDCFGHHDWMRGMKGAEKKALESIRLCQEEGHKITLDVQLNNITRDTLYETADYFDSIGVHCFRIIRTSESPRWRQFAGEAQIGIEEYFDECIRFLRKYTEKPRNMNVICWEFASFNVSSRKYKAEACASPLSAYNGKLPLCGMCRYRPAIAADGTLYPCHQSSGAYDAQKEKFVNVKKTGLRAAFSDEKYRSEAHRTAEDLLQLGGKCSQCRHFRQCYGGCRNMALCILGDIAGPDPYMCAYYDGDYERKLQEALPDWTNKVLSET